MAGTLPARECTLHLRMSRARVNMLTSLMPAMEGLFLASVTDGKQGHVTLRFDRSVADDVHAMVAALQAAHGDEVCLRDPEADPEAG